MASVMPKLMQRLGERYDALVKSADGSISKEVLDAIDEEMDFMKKEADKSSSVDEVVENSTKNQRITEVDKIDDRLKNITDQEHVYRIDANGVVHGPKIGDIDRVNFNDLGPFEKGDIITHNHPSGATFSLQDISNLSTLDITELRAITKSKKYIIRKTGVFKYGEWRIKYDKLVSDFRVKYADKLKQGMSFEEKIIMQEYLYKEAFKGTKVKFIIE